LLRNRRRGCPHLGLHALMQAVRKDVASERYVLDSTRDKGHSSEFLQVIQLQLEVVTARESNLRRQQRFPRRSGSRSPPNPRSQSPPSMNPRSRTASPDQVTHYQTRSEQPPSNHRRYRPHTPPPPPAPPIRLDLDPHQEAGRTTRPSPEEESVIGWTAYSEERARPADTPPHNPFAADMYRSSYQDTNVSSRGQQDRRARTGYRNQRGNTRGRGQNRS
jgi:hypothetical protein